MQPHHSPHPWALPNYGKPTQITTTPDNSAPLTVEKITHLQQAIFYLLFYAQSAESTIIPALVTLAPAHSRGTQATAQSLTELLNYSKTYPDATFR